VEESNHLLGEIILASIDIYVVKTSALFQKGDPGIFVNLVMCLMEFQQSHNESLTKQRYTNMHAELMIKKFLNKDPEAFIDKLPKAIKSVGSHPFFVDTSDGTVKPHTYYYPIAIEINKLLLKGWGSYKIRVYLNEKYTPPKNKKFWGTKIIAEWAKSAYLTGTRSVKVGGTQYQLDGYYPVVSTLGELDRIQQQRSSRKGSSGIVTSTLFTGIKILKCGYCGYSMTGFTQHGKLRVTCNGGRENVTKCKAWGFNLNRLEDIACRLLFSHIWNPDQQEQPINTSLQEELDAVELRITTLLSELENVNLGLSLSDIAPTLNNLKAKKETLTEQIRNETINQQVTVTDNESYKLWRDLDPAVLDVANKTLRLETKELFRTTVESILCYRGEKERQRVFIFKLKDGTEYTVKSFTNHVEFPFNALGQAPAVSDSESDGVVWDVEYHLMYWGNPDYRVEIGTLFEDE
jgi:hypothetical protein